MFSLHVWEQWRIERCSNALAGWDDGNNISSVDSSLSYCVSSHLSRVALTYLQLFNRASGKKAAWKITTSFMAWRWRKCRKAWWNVSGSVLHEKGSGFLAFPLIVSLVNPENVGNRDATVSRWEDVACPCSGTGLSVTQIVKLRTWWAMSGILAMIWVNSLVRRSSNGSNLSRSSWRITLA